MTVQQLQSAVRRLSPEELDEFRAWFSQFDADVWDRQFEAHLRASRRDPFQAAAADDSAEDRLLDI